MLQAELWMLVLITTTGLILRGLPEEPWDVIEDAEFRARLRDAEDLAWAFPELCADGVVPPARFSTNAGFMQFRSRFAEALIESGLRRFCLCWRGC
jgi:hypothetical protein